MTHKPMGKTERDELRREYRREDLGQGVRGGGATFAWFELWVEEVSCPPYLLILLGGERHFAILDPLEGNRIAYRPTSYDDACNWLSEDEFNRSGDRTEYQLMRTVDDLRGRHRGR